MNRKIRFAVVASHAIPYYVPFYRALTKYGDIDVHAFFATKVGIAKTLDAGMGIELAWKTDLLAGYAHTFLPEADGITKLTFSEIDNPSLAKTLDAFDPDIVLIHGYTQKTMLRAIAWCRRRGVPALMISDSSLHVGTSPVMRLAKAAVLPVVLGQFSAFLSIGDANQKYLETFGVPAKRIFRVPNMVDEGFWSFRARREQERARVRAQLNLEPDDLVALFVGKIIARKRPGDLVAALARLRDTAAPARHILALFAGDGAERAELEREAKAQGLPARFLGFVNIDDLPGYYCAADLMVHPAEIETFGVIVLEGAIMGLPLVLSDHVGAIGPTSIARPGENALIHRCGDVAGLAAALQDLAQNPAKLAQMAAASLRISEELDYRMSVRNTLKAIDFCLNRTVAEG
ncbi:MAG TPA: glycosyltransferase family 4 protein [Rhizomicrobium sp.]|jgi:glycosyltransferase involved in cell wall biosynthesis|nr:glycosyltransferase family 4 protein [Rhizomicrobium sp.]